MSTTPDLTPLVSFLPALLFIAAEIALGIAAAAAGPRLPKGRRGAAVTGGLMVLAAGLIQIAAQVLVFTMPDLMAAFALPVTAFHTLSAVLHGAATLLFAGGGIALVLAATRAPARPGPHTPGGAYPPPGAHPHPGR
ncbi:hypothetical protein SUDANB121_03629 [Nocardiopsis dassonvillei]|uniref:hypothetical protein n=1 Tax=Nocardiopsis dassonvillei TaxID=2014 RepID=UPI003F557349